jgi:hypothetical protein
LFKASSAIRCAISISIKKKGFKKNSKTGEILGCSFPKFKESIEHQFTKGMTWLNHGEWELDHKVPMALAKTKEEVIKLNHYSNFQPLWKTDNLAKSDSLLPEFKELAVKLLGRNDF